jgi:hypothetical protein
LADEKTTSLVIFENNQILEQAIPKVNFNNLNTCCKPRIKSLFFLHKAIELIYFLHHQIPFVHWIQFQTRLKTERLGQNRPVEKALASSKAQVKHQHRPYIHMFQLLY